MSRPKNNDQEKAQNTPKMITPEMEALADNLRGLDSEIKKEKTLLNEFQQQKDKIEKFWSMAKENREDLMMQLRNKLRQKQDLEEKHAFEIKIYKQKVKHLLHEQQANVTDVLYEGQVALKLLQDDNRQVQHEHKSNIRALKKKFKEMELAQNALKQSIKQEIEKQIMKVRIEFERMADELKDSYEIKMKTARETCERKRKLDTSRIEARKKKHIRKLMKNHKEKFQAIKRYYRDITIANLDSIKTLKADVGESTRKEQDLEKEVKEQERENKRLLKPLNKHRELHKQLVRDLELFEQDEKDLKECKTELKDLGEQQKNLNWEHEIMEQKLSELRKEKTALEEKLQGTIYELQQRTGFRNLLLEKKLQALSVDLLKTEAALAEVIASTMPAESGAEVKNSLEDVLNAKNQEISGLKRKLAELKQKYHDAIVHYENVLVEHSVPLEELGFVPVKRF